MHVLCVQSVMRHRLSTGCGFFAITCNGARPFQMACYVLLQEWCSAPRGKGIHAWVGMWLAPHTHACCAVPYTVLRMKWPRMRQAYVLNVTAWPLCGLCGHGTEWAGTPYGSGAMMRRLASARNRSRVLALRSYKNGVCDHKPCVDVGFGSISQHIQVGCNFTVHCAWHCGTSALSYHDLHGSPAPTFTRPRRRCRRQRLPAQEAAALAP